MLLRKDGYAPIREYAAIGDGRTVALVARDGSIDWLCLPNLDSPSAFGALVDARRGGAFSLAPDEPYEAERRYVPRCNAIETVFSTASGAVRVVDAMTLPDGRLGPGRELARRVEGLAGHVAMRWRVTPRFGYGAWPTRVRTTSGVPIASAGPDALAIRSWDAGEPVVADGSVEGAFDAHEGSRALLALGAAYHEPVVLAARDHVESRLDRTCDFWRRWSEDRSYDGPWRDAVERSALALKLLVYSPSGAVAAAPTTSLPEEIGGVRNWDYRYSWIRDASFTLDALLELGCPGEGHAFFWWALQASQLTHPRLHVLYRLDGGLGVPERELPFEGYAGSRPVRIGNGAARQRQLDVYGDLFEAAWTYVDRGYRLDAETGKRLAEMADLVCAIWREPDAGIWEVRSPPRHFTQSKMMCWVALDRALRLVDAGQVPGRHSARWRADAQAIHDFVDTNCWSDTKRAFVRFAGSDELDASVLLGAIFGFHDPERFDSTIDAIRRELGRGPLLYRYGGEDGLHGDEGMFLACSFWLVDALARCGRLEEAAGLMDELVGLANDVGLYAEEIEPETGEFLGNFPQGLTHLALITAAVTVSDAGAR